MLKDLTLLQQTKKKVSQPPQLYRLKNRAFVQSCLVYKTSWNFFSGKRGGVKQNHLICERGPLIILIFCSGCYLGIHPSLKFQKSNLSFRGAKNCLKQLRSINTTSPWRLRPPLHQRDKEAISASCLSGSLQTASPILAELILLGNWSAAVKEASHYLKKSSMVQREVQCQAAAQGNKPLFIWKRMLFVSHTSLLESLLSIAINVLLTGHFIMLLTPWGMIPVINWFRGQTPGSAVTYCHHYWLRPTSRFSKSTRVTGGDQAQSNCCCCTLTDTAGKELSWLLRENQIKGHIQGPLRCIMRLKQKKELLVHIPTCRAAGSLHTLLTANATCLSLVLVEVSTAKSTQKAPAWWKHTSSHNCTAVDVRQH